MPRRTLLSILLVPTVVVLFGAATMGASNAVGGPAGPSWPGPPICATGDLTLVSVQSTTVELAGFIQPCPGTDPTAVAAARWGVAEYHTLGAIAHQYGLRPYASATGPTAFTVGIPIPGSVDALWGPLQATCLVSGPKSRVACVEITQEWNGTLRVAPIPVTDPRVAARVTLLPEDGPDPECGACV